MDWQPINETHAITVVRLLVNFTQPLPQKVLLATQTNVRERQTELRLNSINEVNDSANTPMIQVVMGQNPHGIQPPVIQQGQRGLVFQRVELPENGLGPPRRHEEVGLRPLIFGYVADSYTRWNDFEKRYFELLEEPLEQALRVATVSNVQLEFRNVFKYIGDKEQYSSLNLFNSGLGHIPTSAISHERHWEAVLSWAGDIAISPHDGGTEPLELATVFAREYRGIQISEQNTGNTLPGIELVNAIHVLPSGSNGFDVVQDQLKQIIELSHNELHLKLIDTLTAEMSEALSLKRGNYE